jgi:hypothetical protein
MSTRKFSETLQKFAADAKDDEATRALEDIKRQAQSGQIDAAWNAFERLRRQYYPNPQFADKNKMANRFTETENAIANAEKKAGKR